MTEIEKRAILALQAVAMPKETWHGRRAEYLHMRLQVMPNARLVETQAGDLWYLCWRYRRQITDAAVVERADYIVNGALHLAFDGSEESLQREGR
jgi:hypothetical protein